MSPSGYRPAGFLLATLAWTWGFWLLLAALGVNPWHGAGQVLPLDQMAERVFESLQTVVGAMAACRLWRIGQE